jgi:hypothetical protein
MLSGKIAVDTKGHAEMHRSNSPPPPGGMTSNAKTPLGTSAKGKADPKSASRSKSPTNEKASASPTHKESHTPKPIIKEELRSTFKSKIVGDIFGSTTNGLDGMMYRSRVMAKLEQQKKTTKLEEIAENEKSESVVSSVEIMSDSDSDDDFKHFKTMNPKQQLALTMKNWTSSADNDEHIISEGGVQALIALCHVEDAGIRKCCASSFYNLSNRVQNREKLLSSGATNGVVLCLHGSPPRCTW